MQQTVGASYPILADPTRATAQAYGVFDLLGDGVAAPAWCTLNSGQCTARLFAAPFRTRDWRR